MKRSWTSTNTRTFTGHLVLLDELAWCGAACQHLISGVFLIELEDISRITNGLFYPWETESVERNRNIKNHHKYFKPKESVDL